MYINCVREHGGMQVYIYTQLYTSKGATLSGVGGGLGGAAWMDTNQQQYMSYMGGAVFNICDSFV